MHLGILFLVSIFMFCNFSSFNVCLLVPKIMWKPKNGEKSTCKMLMKLTLEIQKNECKSKKKFYWRIQCSIQSIRFGGKYIILWKIFLSHNYFCISFWENNFFVSFRMYNNLPVFLTGVTFLITVNLRDIIKGTSL